MLRAVGATRGLCWRLLALTGARDFFLLVGTLDFLPVPAVAAWPFADFAGVFFFVVAVDWPETALAAAFATSESPGQ